MADNNPANMKVSHQTALDPQSTLYKTGVTLPVFRDEYLIRLGWTLSTKEGWASERIGLAHSDSTIQVMISRLAALRRERFPVVPEDPGEYRPLQYQQSPGHASSQEERRLRQHLVELETEISRRSGLVSESGGGTFSHLTQLQASRQQTELQLQEVLSSRKAAEQAETDRRNSVDAERREAHRIRSDYRSGIAAQHDDWYDRIGKQVIEIGTTLKELTASDGVRASLVQRFVTTVYDNWSSLMQSSPRSKAYSAVGFGVKMDPPLATCIDVLKMNTLSENVRDIDSFWSRLNFYKNYLNETVADEGAPAGSLLSPSSNVETDARQVASALHDILVVAQYAQPGTVKELPPDFAVDVFIPALPNGQTLRHGVLGVLAPTAGPAGQRMIASFGHWKRPIKDNCRDVVARLTDRYRGVLW